MSYAEENLAKNLAAAREEHINRTSTVETKNGFADPAKIDIAEQDAQGTERETLSPDEALSVLTTTINRHPLHREILFKTLVFCTSEQPLSAIEQAIESSPEYKQCSQSPYQLIKSLAKAYGVKSIERDANGAIIASEDKEGLPEDDIDDLVCSLGFKTTETGTAFIEKNQPRARLAKLLSSESRRSETYIELLDFIDDAPRTYSEIGKFLAGKPVLETLVNGVRETMQPSVFVDRLERAGALVWNEGWTLSQDGKNYLETLKQAKETSNAR